MGADSESRHRHDPDLQLERLGRRCRSLTPVLYREEALYLQIVRDQLSRAVRTAIKHLVCARSVDPTIRRADGVDDLLRRVDALVQRTTSLITVEQLLVTADRLRRDAQRNRLLQVQALTTAVEQPSVEQSAAEQPSAEQPAAPGVCEEVHLGLSLPLERPDLIEGLFPAQETVEESPDCEMDEPSQDDLPPPQETTELDLLRSLFVLAGEAIEPRESSTESTDSTDPLPRLDGTESNQLMPTSPSALLVWMEGIDAALSRRLRNLSHALNVELMRAGIIRSLLPIQLLEAALNGHIPSEATQSNLLKLQLPLPTAGDQQSYEAQCLLLRSSELEFDDHALRRCRGRLQHQRRALSTLVVKERHWQRRSSAREVQTHWWPNQTESPPHH
ncbi:hypothetical protein [Synechococcus sp. CS-197]|uniref:hypothetical protein n=1 Tax=Synechococcus sp. CS-197 TaxID=2847985 RepID=UPI000321C170|nr:hypothetical protein [Synechococcus sp. CS-197]MCT0252174.1 hypothetical protein [Synechococcus sp. CS-197]